MRAAFSDALDAVLGQASTAGPRDRSSSPRRATRSPSYVSALLFVYTLLIIAYILTLAVLQLRRARALRRAGRARCSGSCATSASRTCAVFRRFIPPLGPLDFSPIVAILVLQIVGGIVVGLIRG